MKWWRVSEPVRIASTPDVGDTYITNEVIRIAVDTSEAVYVDTSGGAPSIGLGVGGNVPDAGYSGDPAPASVVALLFDYTVVRGDADTDGVAVAANSLRLTGSGTIRDVADNDLVLTHAAVAAQSARKVNGAGTPGAPQDVLAVIVSESPNQLFGSVRLSWSPPSVDGGLPVLRYQYQFIGAPNWEDVAGGAAATSKTLEITTGHRTGRFQIRAVNRVGAGTVSPAIRAILAPLAVASLTAAGASATQIDISWTAPGTESGVRPVTGYRIEVSDDAGST